MNGNKLPGVFLPLLATVHHGRRLQLLLAAPNGVGGRPCSVFTYHLPTCDRGRNGHHYYPKVKLFCGCPMGA